MKVAPFDEKLIHQYCKYMTFPLAVLSLVLAAMADTIAAHSLETLLAIAALIISAYLVMLVLANTRKRRKIKIGETTICLREGNIFYAQEGVLRVFAFNEYFDTYVDDRLISKKTLNGQMLSRLSPEHIQRIDETIAADPHLVANRVEGDIDRAHTHAKTIRYKLGSTVKYEDMLLTAMTHFNEDDNAYLSSSDYLLFLIEYWKEISRVSQGYKVVMPVLGSGLTRFADCPSMTIDNKLDLILLALKHCGAPMPSNLEVDIVMTPGDIKKANLFRIGEGLTE